MVGHLEQDFMDNLAELFIFTVNYDVNSMKNIGKSRMNKRPLLSLKSSFMSFDAMLKNFISILLP